MAGPVCSAYMTGMPPPAGADDDGALLQQPLDLAQLEDAAGPGRGHDAAEVLAVRLDGPAPLGRQALGGGPVVDGPDGLAGVLERRVVDVHLDHRQERRQGLLEGHEVAQLLLHEVADHALRLGTQDVQRVRRDLRVGGALEGQQPDLRPVAVGDDQLVLDGEGCQLRAGDPHVLALVLAAHGLAAAKQRIAAEGDDDSHPLVLPCWSLAGDVGMATDPRATLAHDRADGHEMAAMTKRMARTAPRDHAGDSAVAQSGRHGRLPERWRVPRAPCASTPTGRSRSCASSGRTATAPTYDLTTLRWLCPCAFCRGEAGQPGWLDSEPDAHRRAGRRSRTSRSWASYALQPVWADGHATGFYTFEHLRGGLPLPGGRAPAGWLEPGRRGRAAAPSTADRAGPAGGSARTALLASAAS